VSCAFPREESGKQQTYSSAIRSTQGDFPVTSFTRFTRFTSHNCCCTTLHSLSRLSQARLLKRLKRTQANPSSSTSCPLLSSPLSPESPHGTASIVLPRLALLALLFGPQDCHTHPATTIQTNYKLPTSFVNSCQTGNWEGARLMY
jgi:hypothetical protein